MTLITRKVLDKQLHSYLDIKFDRITMFTKWCYNLASLMTGNVFIISEEISLFQFLCHTSYGSKIMPPHIIHASQNCEL
jgi:hypothetical protein